MTSQKYLKNVCFLCESVEVSWVLLKNNAITLMHYQMMNKLNKTCNFQDNFNYLDVTTSHITKGGLEFILSFRGCRDTLWQRVSC